MITATHPLTLAQLWAVAALRGVRNTLALASGPVDMGRVDAVAEEPTRLRVWMPVTTASSEPLCSM